MSNLLEQLQFLLVIAGTLLPVLGFVIAWALAQYFNNPVKSLIILLVPALALGLAFLFGEQLAYDGNMLFAITLIIGLLFAGFVYYPGLLLFWIIQALRKRRNRPDS